MSSHHSPKVYTIDSDRDLETRKCMKLWRDIGVSMVSRRVEAMVCDQ